MLSPFQSWRLGSLIQRMRTPVVINMLWSMTGSVIPLFAAVITIPYLVEALGVARFGVLSLAWVVVGYFSLFDMGLGKALTQLVAKKLASVTNMRSPRSSGSEWGSWSFLGASAPSSCGYALRINKRVMLFFLNKLKITLCHACPLWPAPFRLQPLCRCE